MKNYPIPEGRMSAPNPVYVKLLLDSLKYLVMNEKDRLDRRKLSVFLCRCIDEAARQTLLKGQNYSKQAEKLEAEIEGRLGCATYFVWLNRKLTNERGISPDIDFAKQQRARRHWALQLIKEFGG